MDRFWHFIRFGGWDTEMFKCRKVIKLEYMLKLNPGYSSGVEGPMHKCLSAERLSHLNIETEPRIIK